MDIKSILDGEQGEELQEEYLQSLIEAQINLAFDMLRVIAEPPIACHSHPDGHFATYQP